MYHFHRLLLQRSNSIYFFLTLQLASFPVRLQYCISQQQPSSCPYFSHCCLVLPSLGPQRHGLLFLIKNTVPLVYMGPCRSPHNHLSLNWVTFTSSPPQIHVRLEAKQQAELAQQVRKQSVQWCRTILL